MDMSIIPCINKYDDICEREFQFFLSDNDNTFNISLCFSPKQFLHLSGISKIDSHPIIDKFKQNSTGFFNYFQYPYEKQDVIDNNASEIYKLAEKTVAVDTTLVQQKESKKTYHVNDRLNELENLYNYFISSIYDDSNKDCNIHFYEWIRDGNENSRPHYSKIVADYLITFDKSSTEENVCFFVKKDDVTGKCIPISIYPSDISYSNDGRITLPECKILRAIEIDLDKTKVLYELPAEKIQDITSKLDEKKKLKEKNKRISNDLKRLKSKRVALSKDPQNEKLQEEYKKRKKGFFKSLKTDPLYSTIEVIKDIISRLEDQMNDPHNSETTDFINDEIEETRKILQEKQSTLNKSNVNAIINQDGTISIKRNLTESILISNEMKKNVSISVNTLLNKINEVLHRTALNIRNALTIDKKNTFLQSTKPTPTKKHTVKKAASQKRSSTTRSSSTVHTPKAQKSSIQKTKTQAAVPKHSDQARSERPTPTERQHKGETKTYHVTAKQRAAIVKRLKEEEQAADQPKVRKKDHAMSHDD